MGKKMKGLVSRCGLTLHCEKECRLNELMVQRYYEIEF